jgi:hypothetical protein
VELLEEKFCRRFDRAVSQASVGRLAVKPLLALRIVAPREVGRFHKRPGQVLVAAFGVVLSLLLAVGHPLGLHRPAIAGKVTGLRKSFDIADLHRYGHSQDLPHPRQHR